MKNLMGDGMLKQMKQMQEQLKKAQKELERETVTGSAGNGTLEIVMTGSQKCTAVRLSPEKVGDISPERMQGLIQAAVNDALDKSRKMMAQKIGPLGGGLGGLKF
jgi:hypothetical protein